MEQNPILLMLDKARLTPRFWLSFTLFCISFALDFFDFFLVGFLLAVLNPLWHLTYLQSSIILFTAGIGAICGALFFGTLADNWGRKRTVITATLVCAFGSCFIGFIPDGSWIAFAALRFIVGFGLGGTAGVQVALVVELTPTRYRSHLSALPVVAPSIGLVIASLAAATLLNLIGWRGVGMLGAAPALVGLAMIFAVPESVRWLLSKDRLEEARKSAAFQLGLPLEQIPATPLVQMPLAPSGSLNEVYSRPLRFWTIVVIWVAFSTANYGVYLWGPTIVALLLHVDAGQAARMFFYVTVTGIFGRIAFSFLPIWTGRRRAGAIAGFGAAVTLAGAALFYNSFIGGFPVFVLSLMVGSLFFDGIFCILSPYTAEIFPVRLAARGLGIAQAANGIGKIAGPLCLGLIAGVNNFVTPKATTEALTPAFLFMAGTCLAGAAWFAFFAPEISKKPLQLDDEQTEEGKAQKALVRI